MPDFYCRARDFSLSTSVLWPRPTFRLLHSAAAGTSKSIDSKALEGSHVGQNRNNDQVMHTKGNDRWILYQLEFFYARARYYYCAAEEKSKIFWWWSSITSNMLPDSCHMCWCCWKGKWSIFHVIFHYYYLEIGSLIIRCPAENLANEPLTYQLHLFNIVLFMTPQSFNLCIRMHLYFNLMHLQQMHQFIHLFVTCTHGKNYAPNNKG